MSKLLSALAFQHVSILAHSIVVLKHFSNDFKKVLCLQMNLEAKILTRPREGPPENQKRFLELLRILSVG